MSVRVMAEVWSRLDCGGSELLLALALADYANDDGENVYPSVATLARKTRQSVRTVQRQLADFRRCGWLLVDALDVAEGGRGRSARYQINPHWLKGDKLSGVPRGRGDTHGTPGVTQLWHPRGDIHDTPGGDTAMSPDPSVEPSGYPSVEPPDTALPVDRCDEQRHGSDPTRDAFEVAKFNYPGGTYRDNAWLEAERNFGRLVDDDIANAAELVEAAVAYRDQQQHQGTIGTCYVLSPANFYDPRKGHWRGPFPKSRTKAEVQQDANVAASQEWLRRSEAASDA